MEKYRVCNTVTMYAWVNTRRAEALGSHYEAHLCGLEQAA